MLKRGHLGIVLLLFLSVLFSGCGTIIPNPIADYKEHKEIRYENLFSDAAGDMRDNLREEAKLLNDLYGHDDWEEDLQEVYDDRKKIIERVQGLKVPKAYGKSRELVETWVDDMLAYVKSMETFLEMGDIYYFEKSIDTFVDLREKFDKAYKAFSNEKDDVWYSR